MLPEKNWQKKIETNGLRDTPKGGGEMLLYCHHLIYTHFWWWIHFLPKVSTPILIMKKSKNLTRTPFFHLFSPDFDAISRLTGTPNPLFSHFQKERAGRREFAGADGIPISGPLGVFSSR